MIIVDATAQHLKQFYGDKAILTCRALTVLDDETVVGIAGFYKKNNAYVVFTEITPALLRSPRTIIKAARQLRAWMLESPLPMYALLDPAKESAKRFTRHFGFVEDYSGVMRWAA